MSRFLSQAVITLRKVKDQEPLDQVDIKFIELALNRVIRAGRVPFQRFRDHYMIGSERFKPLDGFAYYRTILLHRKSDVWYPDSTIAQLSIFSVYTGAQQEPPQKVDPENGDPEDHVNDMLEWSHIGPCFSGSYQPTLDPDAITALHEYVEELSRIDTETAVQKANELECFLRKATPDLSFIHNGNLKGVLDAHLNAQHFNSKPRSLYSPTQKVAYLVRQATKYARKTLRKNPMTEDLADQLEYDAKLDQGCEYRGNWRWPFWEIL